MDLGIGVVVKIDDNASASIPPQQLMTLSRNLKASEKRNGFHLNGDQTKSEPSDFTNPLHPQRRFPHHGRRPRNIPPMLGRQNPHFPAVPESSKEAAFKDLHAERGFKVSATRMNRLTTDVEIAAAFASQLRRHNPIGDSRSITPDSIADSNAA